MIRLKAQADKCTNWPCFTCNQPLLYRFSVYLLLSVLMATPSSVHPFVGLYSSTDSLTPPSPVSRISLGLQSYQLQHPGWSFLKEHLQFLGSPSIGVINEVVSCYCLHVCFVRFVCLCILFLASSFSPQFTNWPGSWSENIAGINFLMLLHVLFYYCEWPGLFFLTVSLVS